ncbi:MAG: RimK family alpha-L-glutamate ligase [Flavobacteriaceae bacterium]|nr:RimK family alpha-L-glutamate ligase [Flavobacteriaceae bacterium]
MKIFLLSVNGSLYSTQRLFNEASKMGHYIRIIDHTKCAILFDQNQPKILFNNEDITNFSDAIIPRIGASFTEHGLAIVNQFEKIGSYTIASSQGILLSRNKLFTMQHMVKNNIPIPKTLYTKDTLLLKEQLDLLEGEQCIIKFLEGTHGLGVMLAESKKSAISIIETMHVLNKPILIQEFIKESNGEDIRAYVVGDEVVASMKRSSNGKDFRSNVHRGGSTSAIEMTSEEKEIAVRTAQCLGLDVAGIDLIRSKNGPLVIEANSTAGLEGIEKATRVNVAGKIIKLIEEKRSN